MRQPRLPEDRAPRILIARLSAIGDAILTMPIACALRKRFPEAFLVWVAESPAAALLDGHQALDELIVVPRGWLKSFSTVRELRGRLRGMRFDIAIDPQGLTKSALVGRLSGAKRRIGFGDDKGRELSRWLNNELVRTSAKHVVDCHLALLEPLGIESACASLGFCGMAPDGSFRGIGAPDVEFRVPEKAADAETVDELLRAAGLQDGFAVINPGAGWPSKIWPAARHAAVARHLGTSWGLPSLVVWAGEQERALAETIVAGSPRHARLAPATTMTELAAVLRRARLCLSSDTGPLHLAAAVGTPCVSLHGPTWAERCGPYGKRHIALQRAKLGAALHHDRKTISCELIEAIQVGTVCEACDTILRRRGRDMAA